MEPAILVVDDNEDNSFTLSMRLEACGYSNLAAADNGREALDKMRAQPVDLTLLDIMMPELDGFGVLEAMQADLSLRGVPVPGHLGGRRHRQRGEVHRARRHRLSSKPFNPVLMKARLDKCIEQGVCGPRKRLPPQKSKRNGARTASSRQCAARHRSGAEAQRKAAPRLYDDVTVMFCDIVGCAACTEKSPPRGRVQPNSRHWSSGSKRSPGRHGLEKIKPSATHSWRPSLLSAHDEPVRASVACGLDLVAAGRAFGAGSASGLASTTARWLRVSWARRIPV